MKTKTWFAKTNINILRMLILNVDVCVMKEEEEFIPLKTKTWFAKTNINIVRKKNACNAQDFGPSVHSELKYIFSPAFLYK